MNCRLHPANAPYNATNLSAIAGQPVAPAKVFVRLSATMTHWLDVCAAGAGFAAIRAEWLSLAGGLGAWIGVARPSQTIEGTFQTIDATGRLIVEQASGRVAIEAGDVFFSPRPVSSATAGGWKAYSPRDASLSLCDHEPVGRALKVEKVRANERRK